MAATTASAARTRPIVLVLSCLILLIDGYDLFSLGTIGPSLLRDRAWGATPTTLGTLGSLMALGMPFGSILAGWSADRWGRRAPILIAVVWISLSMLGAALAPNLTLLGFARFCTGAGVGALAPLISTVVTDNAPPRRRTLHLTIALGSIGVGGVLSTLTGRLLLPHTHFQTIFLIGTASILLVPMIWRIIPGGPAHRSRTAERARVRELFAPALRRTTVLLWIAVFASMVLTYSTTAWLPTILTKSGYSLNSSLEFTLAFTTGAVVGAIGLSLIADRGHLKLITGSAFLLAVVALFVLSTNQPRPLLLLVSALAGLGSLGCQNMVVACMTAFYPKHLRATALGFGLGVGRIGAILGPTYLSVTTLLFTSPRAGFFAFMVPALLGTAVIFAMRPAAANPATTESAAAPEQKVAAEAVQESHEK